ncbi:hypothetical protein EDB84DRAFT_1454595 [Lactarius hengduanensis]|nr:hypothetical protein EDB84DRAFT_1454595 [Lactarius hengduanensis]
MHSSSGDLKLLPGNGQVVQCSHCIESGPCQCSIRRRRLWLHAAACVRTTFKFSAGPRRLVSYKNPLFILGALRGMYVFGLVYLYVLLDSMLSDSAVTKYGMDCFMISYSGMFACVTIFV